MGDSPVARLLVAPYGPALRRALADAIRAAKGGDVLAPVTVAAPSAITGVTVRRRLAVELGGLANVSFTSLPQIAERLAAPGLAAAKRPRLPEAVAREAVRVALAAPGLAGPFAPIATNPATEAALLATFADLRDLDGAELRRLAAASPRAAAAVQLFGRFRELCASWADEHEVFDAAAGAIATGNPVFEDVGPVVLYAPRRLRPAEERLLAALAGAQRLFAVVGRTGDVDCDSVTAEPLLARLAGWLGHPASSNGTGPPVGAMVVRAPDPAEEVREAVRLVVDRLTTGVTAERLAIVARVAEPYLLLADEELTAAGIAHHGRANRTLAQTVAGRALLGVVALPDGGFRRADVMAWLRSAPVVDPSTGRPVPAARWDRVSREAGVVGGAEQWRQRLALARTKRAEWVARRDAIDAVEVGDAGEDAEDASGAGDRDEPDHRLAELDALAGFVDDLAVVTDPGGRRGWAALANWAEQLLARYIGGEAAVGAWREPEPAAYHLVLDALGRLAAVDDARLGGAPPDLALFRRALERELDRPAPTAGRLGRGVVVGRVSELVGADVDAVVVLGMAEGTFPPRPRDDAVIPNRERAAVGLAPRGVSRAEERRDYLAALAAAGERILSFPRADPRAQRARQPSRWLLETCTELVGESRPVYGDDLTYLRKDARAAAWFRDLESFEFWLARSGSPSTPHEHDVAGLLAAHRAGLPVDAAAVVAAEPALARGLGAVAARAQGAFGSWTGLAGGRDEFLLDLERPQSATALQTWATCPFRYFLGHVLGVAELDDPTDSDEISALDRGSLVHAVLERFVGEQLGRPPTAPWSADDRRRLADLADEVAAEFESEGRTGRTLLWRLHWGRLRRYLDRILTADDELRRTLGVVPTAVELGFGFPDDAIGPVSVDAGGGRTVVFRGRIDRVDRSPAGDRMVVLDYKTASARGYPALTGDPDDIDLTGAGRHLQLLVYAHAARAAYGDIPVEARFWFVSPKEDPSLRGGPVDDRAQARFRDVLGTIVDGIEHGRFPARPGAEGFFGFENCSWCPYDQVCPTGRAELWTKVRRAPELASLVALAEPDGGAR